MAKNMTDSSAIITTREPAYFFHERFIMRLLDTRKDAKKKMIVFAKDYRTMTSGCRGAAYRRRHGPDHIMKMAISFREGRTGYRRTTGLSIPHLLSGTTGVSFSVPASYLPNITLVQVSLDGNVFQH